MKTDDLIRALAGDPRPHAVSSFKAMLLATILAALAAGIAFSFWIGPRPDFLAALGSVRFDFKFVVTLTLAACAFLMLAAEASPKLDGARRRLVVTVAPAVLFVGVLVELVVTPASLWAPTAIGSNGLVCLTVVPALGALPLLLLLAGLRWGAPQHPAFAGLCAGLLAGALAATFYAANCTDDSPLFVVTWYPPAIGMLAAAGAILGSVAARW